MLAYHVSTYYKRVKVYSAKELLINSSFTFAFYFYFTIICFEENEQPSDTGFCRNLKNFENVLFTPVFKRGVDGFEF